MAETYLEFKARRQKEINDFPMAFAFNQKQFVEGMAKLGLGPDDTDKVLSISGGVFILKTDSKRFTEMFERHTKELDEAIKADDTDHGFVYQALSYELANHEYCITYDSSDALAAVGLTMEEIKGSPSMLASYKAAIARQGMCG